MSWLISKPIRILVEFGVKSGRMCQLDGDGRFLGPRVIFYRLGSMVFGQWFRS